MFWQICRQLCWRRHTAWAGTGAPDLKASRNLRPAKGPDPSFLRHQPLLRYRNKMVSPAWLVPVRPPPGGLRGCARFACYALWPFRRGHSRRNGVFSSLGCCPKSSRLSTLVINGKRGFIRGASPCGQQVQKCAHGGAEYTCALIKQADAGALRPGCRCGRSTAARPAERSRPAYR